MSLLDRTVGFTTALRQAGLPVSTAETVDAVRAMGAIELIARAQLKAALAASVCKKPAYRSTFDTLFDLWFPLKMGDGASAEMARDEGAELVDQPVSGDPQAMRRLGAAYELPAPDAARISGPTLVVTGRQDTIVGFADQWAWADGLARGMPAAGVEYRYPFVSVSSWGTQTIEPIAQLILLLMV